MDARRRRLKHCAQWFPCDGTAADREIAQQISTLAGQLCGVLRVGSTLSMPAFFRQQGISEERYLGLVCSSAATLSRFHVMKCLRSSRAALLEHLLGTETAWRKFAPEAAAQMPAKQATGDLVSRLEAEAGRVPTWQLGDAAKAAAPPWLLDSDAHREACRSDAALYRQIAELVAQMSPAREQAKCEHLRALHRRLGSVIAFDGHVITLELLAQELDSDLPIRCFTGQGGAAAKRRAVDALGLESGGETLVALCSDALSEGINLQGASCVVHLDTPTVVRIAEQRAGRVDRMNSPHAEVEVWWPRDPPELAPRQRDMLRERHELVSDLIGANIELPSDDLPAAGEDALIDPETLAAQADAERELAFGDALQPVRDLIGANGLVSTAVYRRMRASQVELRSCVSWVRGEKPWAFIAVGTARRETSRWAPRWVFFDGPRAEPILDLDRIAALLRERLADAPQAIDHPGSDEVVGQFVEALKTSERALLPLRRRRALEQLERMLDAWGARGWADEPEMQKVVRAISIALRGTGETRLDPRAAADAWLELIRPRIRRALDRRTTRTRLWRLKDLDDDLLEEPIPAARLRDAFDNLHRLPPIELRIEAMIVGVPTSE